MIEDVEADFLLVDRHIRQSELAAEVKWVKDTGELLTALDEGCWDVVLSDFNVPGLDFMEALEIIKKRLPERPIILVSGSIGEETAVELLKNGLCDFVLKDRLHRLVPAIERSLNIRAEKQRRKEAEQKLANNEQLMRAVLDGTSDAIFVKDRQGRYLLANKAAGRFVGYEAEAVIGQDDTFLFKPDTAKKIRERDLKIMEDCTLQTQEEWVTTRDGKQFAFLVTKGPIFDQDGEVTGTFGVALDITERKRAEVALAESELRYRALADSGEALIWTSGLDKMCDYFNQPWLTFTGRSLQQELGNGWTEGVHPEDFERCLQTYNTAFDKRVKFSMEYRLRHASGEYRWLHDNGTPRFDNGGNFLGYIGHCLEITERKRAEEEQKKLQAQLNQAQRMECIGQLAGGVAHDYNNMLSVILGYSEMAKEKVLPGDPLHQDLKEIIDAARRSAEITRQLLAFARKQTICPVVLDLNETIEGILKMLRRLIGEDITLAWLPGAELWNVEMDTTQIDQVLANLCVNARDAIAGVGKITIETKNVTFDKAHCVDHFGLVPGDFTLLAVSDNGSGMDEEILDHIFEPFFTTKGAGEGTGLGLATVYGIVQQNKGFIQVHSEPGKGTTFELYIPRHVGKTNLTITEKVEKTPKGHGETVLIVEDEQSIRNLGKLMLERLGYNVLAASTPSEAIRLAKESAESIDLLVTDVVMPEMNGRELADHLHTLYPNLQILFMSGYTSNVIVHRGVLDDGVNFVPKPFSQKELAVMVQKALGRDLA